MKTGARAEGKKRGAAAAFIFSLLQRLRRWRGRGKRKDLLWALDLRAAASAGSLA